MIDENEFFREVSIRMCGTLEIDKALGACFQFVGTMMPLDKLVIVTYDRVMGCVRNIAIADAQGARLNSDETYFSPALRREIIATDHLYSRTRMANSSGKDPIISLLAENLGWPPSSIMINRLTMDGRHLGSIVSVTRGEGRYTAEHLKVWTLVNETVAIALANHLQYREIMQGNERLADDNRYLRNELRKSIGGTPVGADFGLRDVMDKVRRVAPLASPVLLIGETGTGKELIANAIHELSQKNSGPLIKVNCGAIPETLVDSELFGHEKGAFTGAISQQRGRFERADGGTIFLDEVSELPPQVQVRLLRVLQDKEIERVGGKKTIKVDVRIVSATNRELESQVKKGLFRDDLYFRLNVFPIRVPPLRERKTDIPMLVHHFIHKKAQEMVLPDIPVPFHGETERLMQYDWPGNVRELENAVEKAIILSNGNYLMFDHIIGRGNPPDENRPHRHEAETQRLDELEARHIENVMNKVGGRVNGKGGAADLLGLNPNTLRHRMRKLGINFGRK